MLFLNMACSFSEPIKDTETDLKKQLPSPDTLIASSPSANRRLLTKAFRSRTTSQEVGVLSAAALKIAAREPHDSQQLRFLPLAEMTVYCWETLDYFEESASTISLPSRNWCQNLKIQALYKGRVFHYLIES